MSTAKSFAVNLWSAHPDSGEDACSSGDEFSTLKEALAVADDLWSHFSPTFKRNISHIEIDGPDFHEVRTNPDYKPSRDDDDGEWRREQAMQLGMGLGVDAYNDAMGCSVDEYEDEA